MGHLCLGHGAVVSVHGAVVPGHGTIASVHDKIASLHEAVTSVHRSVASVHRAVVSGHGAAVYVHETICMCNRRGGASAASLLAKSENRPTGFEYWHQETFAAQQAKLPAMQVCSPGLADSSTTLSDWPTANRADAASSQQPH